VELSVVEVSIAPTGNGNIKAGTGLILVYVPFNFSDGSPSVFVSLAFASADNTLNCDVRSALLFSIPVCTACSIVNDIFCCAGAASIRKNIIANI
jgi:hypothetical protein